MKLETKLEDLKPVGNPGLQNFRVYYINDKGVSDWRIFTNQDQAEAFIKSNTMPTDEELKQRAEDLNTRLSNEHNDFVKICRSVAQVLTEKNKRYGNSALKPINVFNGKTAVGQRADDKVSRIANAPELRKNDICDLIGYLVLMCKENNWYDFTDQID